MIVKKTNNQRYEKILNDEILNEEERGEKKNKEYFRYSKQMLNNKKQKSKLDLHY